MMPCSQPLRTGVLSCLSLVLAASADDAMTGTDHFRRVGLPAEAAAWAVSASPDLAVKVEPEATGGVRLGFGRPAQDTRFSVSLRHPVALQREARRFGVWLYAANRFWAERPALRFRFADADGVGYSYQMYGATLRAGTWAYVETPRFWTGELGRLDETMILVEGGLQHRKPVPPLRFVGLDVTVSAGNWVASNQEIVLGPAFSDGIRREDSALYWQTELGDRYLFGDMPFARQPFVFAGDLLTRPGDYSIAWSLRNAQAATRPVAAGRWDLHGFDASPAARFQRLVIPVTAQGQYWLTCDVREAGPKGEHRQVDTWLKLIRGDRVTLPLIAADRRPEAGLLRLNPQREENIYAPGELQTCRVRVWRPADGPAGDLALSVRRQFYPAVDAGPEERFPVAFAAAAEFADVTLPLDLTEAQPLQKLTVSLSRAGAELDRCSQWVGLRELPAAGPWTNRDRLPHFNDLFGPGQHLLSCAEWDPRYPENTDPAKFEAWVLDVKRQNVNTIELFPRWREIEPLEGVYWWDQLDRRVELIAKHGLRVMINLDCTYPPAWMPEESQADEEGMVNGLWHGGGNNVLKSPCSEVLWTHYRRFLQHLTLRYRNQPALVAYSSLLIFFDHFWADHPWQGQYVDYSESAKAGFRRYLRDHHGLGLPELARRWNRPLATWDDVQLPRTDLFLGLATLDRPDPRPEWRDFLDFRFWCQDQFVGRLVAGTVRTYDDVRPIGFHGPLLTEAETYRRLGLYVCAGGSEGSLDGYRKPVELPKRAESIAMSFYTPCYTAMSMTNLLAQGNVHVQNFWMPGWRWDECIREDRKTGTQALAGWFELFRGDLGQAQPVHAESATSRPMLGRLYSRASILYGVRSFHWFRLDDYKVLAERASPVPSATLLEDASVADLAALPCVIVDPTARILPKAAIERLAAYVRDGGKLVLPPTGGMYTDDPADGQHVLRRLLGLPEPRGRWLTAAEIRQPGETYTPYYPFEIVGRGTPGEQSLAEPGQTASAQASADNGVFAPGRRLVFRLGPYSMYNRDTWGDWSHMLPYFIYGRYQEKGRRNQPALATWTDGGTAATLHPVGKGAVLLLTGTPDWYNWRDALGDIAAWAGANQAGTPVAAIAVPYTLSPAQFKGFILNHERTRWAVIRNESTGWTGHYGDAKRQATAKRETGTIRLHDLPEKRYRIRDVTPLLATGLDRLMTKEQLAQDGIALDLIPAETRLLRLDPEAAK